MPMATQRSARTPGEGIEEAPGGRHDPSQMWPGIQRPGSVVSRTRAPKDTEHRRNQDEVDQSPFREPQNQPDITEDVPCRDPLVTPDPSVLDLHLSGTAT